MSLKLLLAIALLQFAIVSALAGQPVSAADSAAAARLFSTGKWADAAKAYERITRGAGAAPGAWMRLGFALDSLGRRTDALRAYEGARHAGAQPAPVMFQLARTHAALGAADRALAYLDSAATYGYQGSTIFAMRRSSRAYVRAKSTNRCSRASRATGFPAARAQRCGNSTSGSATGV
jgi:tetratricopeptide (TPR) repeat protein